MHRITDLPPRSRASVLSLALLVPAVGAFAPPALRWSEETWCLARLRVEDRAIRDRAVVRLGHLRSARAVTPIAEIFRKEVVDRSQWGGKARSAQGVEIRLEPVEARWHVSGDALVQIGQAAAPALFKLHAYALEKDLFHGPVRSCLERVAPEAIEEFLVRLWDEPEGTRGFIARTLGRIGHRHPDQVPALTAALDDASCSVVQYAAESLGKLGGAARPAVPALIRCVDHAEIPVVTAAAEALDKIGLGEEDVPVLFELFQRTENGRKADKAGRVLGRAWPASRAELLDLLSHAETELRLRATRALGSAVERHNSADALDGLLSSLSDPVHDVRACVVAALESAGSVRQGALPTLRRMLRTNPSDADRSMAIIGLMHIERVDAAITEVERVVRDGRARTELRCLAVRALGTAGKRAVSTVPTLVALVASTKGDLAFEAGLALREIGTARDQDVARLVRYVPVLMRRTRGPDRLDGTRREDVARFQHRLPHVERPDNRFDREALIAALVSTQRAAVPTLVDDLRGKGGKFPRADFASEVLRQIGSPALPALVRLTRATNAESRAYAVSTIGAMNSRARPALPSLVRLLRDPSSEVRSLAACSIGNIGERALEALPALLRTLADVDEEVVDSAMQSIIELARGAVDAPRASPDARRVRWSAAELKRTFTKLIDLLADEGFDDRDESGERLVLLARVAAGGRHKEYAAIAAPLLRGYLADRERAGRAAEGLGLLGLSARKAVPDLISLLRRGVVRDEDEWAEWRGSAAQALGRLYRAGAVSPAHVAQVVPELIRSLKNPDHDAVIGTARALASFGPLAREALPALNETARWLSDSDDSDNADPTISFSDFDEDVRGAEDDALLAVKEALRRINATEGTR